MQLNIFRKVKTIGTRGGEELIIIKEWLISKWTASESKQELSQPIRRHVIILIAADIEEVRDRTIVKTQSITEHQTS
jgi:hypothetical protein